MHENLTEASTTRNNIVFISAEILRIGINGLSNLLICYGPLYFLFLYSLRLEKNIKFGPTKTVYLNCCKVHLSKAITNTKK